MKIDWKVAIGALLLAGVVGFLIRHYTQRVEFRKVVEKDIRWVAPIEFKYSGKAELSNVPVDAVPIEFITDTTIILPPFVSLARLDTTFSDSSSLNLKYWLPPINSWDLIYKSAPKYDTTIYYESQKIIRDYPLFSHGVVLAGGYSPLTKRFDAFIGYGITMHPQNFFK